MRMVRFVGHAAGEVIGAVNVVGGETVAPVTTKAFEYLEYWDKAWEALVIPAGKELFNLDIKIVPTGSGDTAFNYVLLLCILALAVAGTLVWSLLDRARPGAVRRAGAHCPG